MTNDKRERLLDPIDRISEILFGLIMAVTIVGSLSVATAGSDDVRTVMIGALGCNLAWGLVDAIMYLIRTATERTRLRTLARNIASADPDAARALLEEALPDHVAIVTGPDELEGMRRRLIARPQTSGAILGPKDYAAATGIFVLVVIATFPVVLPFLLTTDAPLAMQLSRMVTVVMLFLAGSALGRYAGHTKPWLIGTSMAVFGAVLIMVIMALGG